MTRRRPLLRRYDVMVFTHPRGSEEGGWRPPLILAYLRDANPGWEGCCMHTVEALHGDGAKRIAVVEHKERCLAADSLP
jgi:hypothetical protein